MNKESEELIVSFLLGDLSGDERARFEESLFDDAELLRSVHEMRSFLVDRYVLGDLPEGERNKLERTVLASREGNRLLAMTQNLAESVRKREAEEARRRLFSMRRLRGWAPALVFGVLSLILAILLVHSKIENGRLSVQIETMQHGLSGETILLGTEASADTDHAPAVELDAAAEVLNLQVKLSDPAGYPSFRIEIHAATGESIGTWDNLLPANTPNGKTLSVQVPVRSLVFPRYEVRLCGRASNGTLTDLNRSFFSLSRM